MDFDPKTIGMTQEEFTERVIDTIAERFLASKGYDYDNEEEYTQNSYVANQLSERIKKTVDEAIERIAEKHVLPNITKYLEETCLQATNKWGEKKGESLTFIEYLVLRAEHYMTESVDSYGKGKGETDSYGWSGKQSRISYLIHQHLHYNIESAMKTAVSDLNKNVAAGIAETVRQKVQETLGKISVKAEAK